MKTLRHRHRILALAVVAGALVGALAGIYDWRDGAIYLAAAVAVTAVVLFAFVLDSRQGRRPRGHVR